MKKTVFAGLALAFFAFANCKQNAAEKAVANAAAVAAGQKFACPMNCEKGKTYDAPGSCPVCHMELRPVDAATEANKNEYFTAFSADPSPLEAGKAAILAFSPKIRGNESAAVPLDLVHEKKMHLILVSDDLSQFDHVHPSLQPSGKYEIKVLARGAAFSNGKGHDETRFENGGKFWAFTDFKPSGGLNQVNKTELEVAGPTAKPVAFSAEKLVGTVDGFEVKISPAHGATGFEAGSPQHISATVARGSKAVDPASFENYLGEKAHLILVETASKTFLHTHPSVEKGQFDIHTTFEKAGTYRAWLQFQTDGKVHTADFVLRVADKSSSKAADANQHSH